MNRVTLIGNLGRDPEVRYMPDGTCVTKLRLATTEKRKNEKYTEWHNIELFGKLAEIAGDYCKAGKLILVEGQLRTNHWQTKDGQQRQQTIIKATNMRMF